MRPSRSITRRGEDRGGEKVFTKKFFVRLHAPGIYFVLEKCSLPAVRRQPKYWSFGPDEIDHFATFAMASNQNTIRYVFLENKTWASSAVL